LDYKPQFGATISHRIVTKDRGPGYNTKGDPPSVSLGYIPQVPHTYAYYDANYGIMNEHQLSMGECTDKAKVHPEPEVNKRIFYSAELSRVALERWKVRLRHSLGSRRPERRLQTPDTLRRGKHQRRS
jgi:hypothetical protein